MLELQARLGQSYRKGIAAAEIDIDDIVEGIRRISDFPNCQDDMVSAALRNIAGIRIFEWRACTTIVYGAKRSQIKGVSGKRRIRIPVVFRDIVFPAGGCMSCGKLPIERIRTRIDVHLCPARSGLLVQFRKIPPALAILPSAGPA